MERGGKGLFSHLKKLGYPDDSHHNPRKMYRQRENASGPPSGWYKEQVKYLEVILDPKKESGGDIEIYKGTPRITWK